MEVGVYWKIMSAFPRSFAIVDVETTGGSAVNDRVMEVAVIRVEDMKLVEKFSSLVDPGVRIPPFISGITGIEDKDVAGAPMFGEVAKIVYPLMENAVFVAHNARFDYGFMKNEFGRLERSFRADLLCTVQFLRRLKPDWGKYNLDEVMRRFNLSCSARHRAMGDCEVLWEMINMLEKSHNQEILAPAIALTLKYPALPRFISEQDLVDLPEGAGVYLFYNEQDTLLYVGKSIHLKDRIKSHFASDYANNKDQKIREQVARIETIETGGELGALLLESKLVKEKSPLFNRYLRFSKEMIAVRSYENAKGYLCTRIGRVNEEIDLSELPNVMGVFRSKKKAIDYLRELATEYELCPKLLGIEKGKGVCFARQLDNCKGACVGVEKALAYNARFVGAFTKTRIKRWPFVGAIAIDESKDGKICVHVIDQWCYMGQLDGENQLVMPRFDYDVYKILVRFISSNENIRLKNIQLSDIIG